MAIVRPCPNVLDCPPDEPLDNFSSEADDTLDYISTKYFYHNPDNGQLWNKTSCGDTFVSDISQADADQQALANAINCLTCEGSDCVPNTKQTFCNSPQSACSNCPGGTRSCFDVPGGVFCGFGSQAEADTVASNFAYLQSIRGAVCLGPIPQCTCVGSDYSAQITATQAVFWIFNGGSLPPGLTFIDGLIQGVPTSNGQYTFQIKAQTTFGTYTVRNYTITVLEITTTQLAAFSIGTPYSFQLQVAGGSGNYLWKIKSGTLPPGLTMDNNGLISGTPT